MRCRWDACCADSHRLLQKTDLLLELMVPTYDSVGIWRSILEYPGRRYPGNLIADARR